MLIRTLVAFFIGVGFIGIGIVACEVQEQQHVGYLLVDTSEGLVQGVSEDQTISFKGIPYAATPLGEFRWRSPQAPSKREHMLLADQFQNRCYQNPGSLAQMGQTETYTQPESEDCLYLNIYRPDNQKATLPVLLWVHGGGLTAGSGARPVNHGAKLSQLGIIVVTFNYRLGAFGFFAHPQLSENNPDKGAYNYGLLDQVAALKWVKQNITLFGGDPNRITVAGESAGAASVNALMVSPLTQGLIAGAISQSGYFRNEQPRVSALNDSENLDIEQMGLAFAKRLNLPDASIDELRSIAPEKVIEATDFNSYITFAVDGYSLEENIYRTMESAKQKQVPWMFGTTDFEFGMVPPAMQRSLMAAYFSAEEFAQVAELYGGEQVRDALLYSDYVFHSQARAIAMHHHRAGLPVYMYRFALRSNGLPDHSIPTDDIVGAYHASELPYMFGNFTGDHKEPITPSANQRRVSEQMMQYWSNFVKNGNPNGPELPKWKPFDGQSLLHIKLQGPVLVADPWAERLDKINTILGDISSYLSDN